MKKIFYITGTRADFGLMKYALRKIHRDSSLNLKVFATGMHLMTDFGVSVNEVEKEEYTIDRVDVVFENDSKLAVTNFIGSFINKFSKILEDERPDIVMVLGDRPEMLAGAIASVYQQIAVVHVHGGDKSGTVDEFARHAITKLAHLHLPATEKSAERIIKMGEDKSRVFIVGAPGLDIIREINFKSRSELAESLGFDQKKPYAILLQHAVSAEIGEAAGQIKTTLEAIKDLMLQTLVIYPNADPGGREMIKVITQYSNIPYIKIQKNMDHERFIQTLGKAGVLIGNSSSGIIEAPSLKIPVVNIGTRQKGRERADNILDVSYNKKLIKQAIMKALRPSFKNYLSGHNPYGDGKSGDNIVKILNKISIDKKLLEKQITY